MTRPSFDELPLRKGDPPFSAWGLYGPDDELGTLNLLTPEVVKEAGKEIQTGTRVGLNLPIDFLTRPSHSRLKLTHKVIWKDPRAVHDDLIEMNTQISSQWDGFRHYGYQDIKKFYNGATVEDISGPNCTTKLGIQAWCEEGIAGRGVLLDYLRWSQSQGKHYDLISDHIITAEDLKTCAKAQNLTLRQGDILLVRSGFKVGYEAMSEEARIAWSHETPARWVGVEASVEMFRWLWDTGICACAGDAPAWERMPFTGRPILHEVMLSGWGMPIGEMFDLEKLSEECLKQGRYSFFFTSMPLHLAGGVGSPPNVMVIF